MTSNENIIALVGLSGVGKSTLIRRITAIAPVTHLEAGSLIKAELPQQGQYASSENLRQGDIAANQELLIRGFKRACAAAPAYPIILDGHVLVDTDAGVAEIPSTVFSQLGIGVFCFLQADPDQIAQRRLADQMRARPRREIGEIAAQQDLALAVCARIARDLQISVLVITSEQPRALLKVIGLG